MKYTITAISMDKETRQYIEERKEIIDTETNALFASCNTEEPLMNVKLVETIYETFWNIPSADETVKVVNIKIMGDN